MITPEQQRELEELIKPMLQWIKENCPPSTTLIIDEGGSQLVHKMFRVLNLKNKD